MAAGLGAGESGHAVGIGAGGVEAGGIFAEDVEFDVGERFAGVGGVGVDEGFVLIDFPGEADVGELEEDLGGDGFGVGVDEALDGGAFEGDEEEGEGGGFGEVVVPVEFGEGGVVDFAVEADGVVGEDFPGEEFEGEGVAAFDRFVVMAVAGVVAVALEGADGVGALELLDAEADGGEVDRFEAVEAVAGGELGFVLAGGGEAGGDVLERDLFGDGFLDDQSVGSGEAVLHLDVEVFAGGEVAVEDEGAAAAGGGELEVGGGWFDGDELAGLLEGDFFGEGFVEGDGEVAGGS